MDDEEQQNQDTDMEEAVDDEEGEGDSESSLLVPFVVFLVAAIFADIFSLIPYAGVIASWPFAALFMGYKFMSGMDFKRTAWVSVGDGVAEGFFSSLPANTADVLISFAMKSKIIGKLVTKLGRAGKIVAAVVSKGKGAGGAGAMESEAAVGAEAAAGAKTGDTAEGVPTEGAPAAEAGPAAREAGAAPEAASLPPEGFGLPPEERAPGVMAPEGAIPEEEPETAGKPGISPEKEKELEEAVGGEPAPKELEEMMRSMREMPQPEEEKPPEEGEEETKRRTKEDDEKRKREDVEKKAREEVL